MAVGTSDAACAAICNAGGKAHFTAIGRAAIAIGVGAVARTYRAGSAGADAGCIVGVTHIAAAAAVGFIGLGVDLAAVADACIAVFVAGVTRNNIA